MLIENLKPVTFCSKLVSSFDACHGGIVFDHTEFFKDYTYCSDTLTECIRAVKVYVRERLKIQQINLKANIAGRKNATTQNENTDENFASHVNDFAESVAK